MNIVMHILEAARPYTEGAIFNALLYSHASMRDIKYKNLDSACRLARTLAVARRER